MSPRKRNRNRRGRPPLKFYLEQNPHRRIYENGNLVHMRPPGQHDKVEMRELSSEKLFGHVTDDGQLFQCPDCQHRYIIPHQQWDHMVEAVRNEGRDFIGKCDHCERTEPILYLAPGQPPMVWIWIK